MPAAPKPPGNAHRARLRRPGPSFRPMIATSVTPAMLSLSYKTVADAVATKRGPRITGPSPPHRAKLCNAAQNTPKTPLTGHRSKIGHTNATKDLGRRQRARPRRVAGQLVIAWTQSPTMILTMTMWPSNPDLDSTPAKHPTPA